VILLVRHAMPVVDPSTPAEQWHLGAEGRAAARLLAPLAGHFVASTEPKAVETLEEVAGGPVATDAGFAEVRRPHVWGDDYRATARAYLRGVRQEGWEPQEEVAERFEAAIARHRRDADVLVVGTHGLVSTLWLAGRCGIEPVPFWEALRFPDLVAVDLLKESF
jgi:broad specificity phosphatase PhoE